MRIRAPATMSQELLAKLRVKAIVDTTVAMPETKPSRGKSPVNWVLRDTIRLVAAATLALSPSAQTRQNAAADRVTPAKISRERINAKEANELSLSTPQHPYLHNKVILDSIQVFHQETWPFLLRRRTRAGTPTTRLSGGTSRFTTEPAPVIERAPIRTGATNMVSLPMNAPSSMTVRFF